jgi:hypothetical protein
MTAAQRALLKGTNASLSKRGVSLATQPDNKSMTGLVQEVDDKARKILQIMDDEITHVLHILRSDLAAQNVNARTLTGFTRADSSQTYRAQHFRDNPQSLKVLFFCVAA